MKTNFDSKLFEKQIDLKSCNAVMGGDTGCSTITFSGPTGQTNAEDSTTTYYNEGGHVIDIVHCNYR